MYRQGFNGRAENGGLCWKANEGEFEGVLMEFGLMRIGVQWLEFSEGKKERR